MLTMRATLNKKLILSTIYQEAEKRCRSVM